LNKSDLTLNNDCITPINLFLQDILEHTPKMLIQSLIKATREELMVYVRKTPSQLTVWDFTLELPLLILICVIMGAACIISSFSVTILTCQRQAPTTGSCQLVDTNLLWHNQSTIPLDTLQGASVRSYFSGKTTTYRIILFTQTGEIPITNSISKGEQEDIAFQIDTFIKNSNQKSLEVSDHSNRGNFFFGLFIWGCGLLFPLFNSERIEIITCSWDETLGQITLKQRDLLSPLGSLDLSLQEIASAAIESTLHSAINRYGKTFNYSKYYLVLVLQSGARIRLGWDGTVLLKSKQQVVNYISTILHQHHLANPHRHQQQPELENVPQPSTLEQEIATWKTALLVNPNNAEAHYHLGLALYRHNQPKEATAHLELAKELFTARGDSKKADEVQILLWQFGLE
jgi:hypothetical protein